MAIPAIGRATTLRFLAGALFTLGVGMSLGAPGTVQALDPLKPSVRHEVAGTRPQGAAGDLTIDSLPSGFQDTIVIDGLSTPSAVAFAPDGRVFVAEKAGRIKVFDDLTDTTATLFADLRPQVMNYWDRGLLGLAVPPNLTTDRAIYVLYTWDHNPEGSPATWGDACPSPPGPTTDGCPVEARLSRLNMTAGGAFIDEDVLIEDWCQQFPSHSIGTLMFGRDGKLYVGGGDGASFGDDPDYGQLGGSSGSPTPVNPCGDPVDEGGSLRSQDLREGGDAVGLDGAILRVEPITGAGVSSNPNGGSGDANTRRIIAEGFRNPFRFTQRPGTDEVWVGDVGQNTWEEIDRIVPGAVRNAGWPCYEGVNRFSKFDNLDLPICEDLYAAGAGAVISPHFQYDHRATVTSADGTSCGQWDQPGAAISTVIAGITFYSGAGSYPSSYDGGLFFLDNARECLWWMEAGAGGVPDASSVALFATGVASPVQLVEGPAGDLYYVALDPDPNSATDGAIHRIKYVPGDNPPVAAFTWTPTTPGLGQTITLDAGGSSDPDMDQLTFAWDFDNDGQYDDATGEQPTTSFGTPGDHIVRLRVSDGVAGGTATVAHTISVANSAPVPVIDTPGTGGSYTVGQSVPFSGHATDMEDGAIPASGLSWTLAIEHCPSDCHEHIVQTFDGVASGTLVIPDHTYPSSVRIYLTASDAFGKTTTVQRDLTYATAVVSLRSAPSGAKVLFDGTEYTTPKDVTVLKGSAHSLSTAATQTFAGASRSFVSWSDGGARSHTITASANVTFTATFSGPPVQDTTAPTFTLLRASILKYATIDPATPGRVRWAATDDQSGIARFDAQVTTDNGAHWSTIQLSPVTRTDLLMTLWQKDYRFRVRATDAAGNSSSWKYTGTVRPSSSQESNAAMKYTGTWTTVSSSSAWAGAVRRANANGESVSFTFTGHSVAWIAPRGPGYGIVRIYVDGVLRATIDLGAGPATSRMVQWVADYTTAGKHTIKVVNLGTSGRPLADHDAFLILR